MKRLAFVLFTFAILTIRAFPAPPTAQELGGEWWDESNRDAFRFEEGGKAVRTDCTTQDVTPGTWKIVDRKLIFTPDEGKQEPSSWFAEMRHGRLTLATNGFRFYRKESREDRETRLLEAHWEEIHLRALHAPKDRPGEEAAILLRKDEIKASIAGLSTSLFGGDVEAQKEGAKLLADVRDPELARLLRAGDKGALNIKCANQLKQIGVYFALYESKHKKYPATLDDIESPDLLTDGKLLDCPVTGVKGAFVYVPPANGEATADDAVMAYETQAHPDGNLHVLTFLGQVIHLSSKELAIAMKKGVGAAVPHMEVKECRLVKGTNGREDEILLFATLVGLKPMPADSGHTEAAVLNFYVEGGASMKSVDPIRIAASDKAHDTGIEQHIRVGKEGLRPGMKLRIDTNDKLGNRVFIQIVEIERPK